MVSGIFFAAAASVIASSVRLYFQDFNDSAGGVRETLIDVGSGQVSGGTSFDVKFEAKVESPIAAMETTVVRFIILFCC